MPVSLAPANLQTVLTAIGACFSLLSLMAGFPQVHAAYYFSSSIQFSILLPPIDIWLILTRCECLDFSKICYFPCHVPNRLQAICVIFVTSLVFPTPPKLVSSVTFLHMFFAPLYRSLVKRLNRTRPSQHCRANDKGVGEAELLPERQPWHRKDVM